MAITDDEHPAFFVAYLIFRVVALFFSAGFKNAVRVVANETKMCYNTKKYIGLGGVFMLEEKKGELFFPGDAWRVAIKRRAHALNQTYNALTEEQTEERQAVLRELLGELREGVSFNGPIRFHYGVHTKIGKNTFFNFNFTCQDDATVTIGENCDFGPNVTIVTPLHPMLASERKALRCPDGTARRLCWAKPVVIGNGCWICANVTILPGVTIGENCVIGAGSVVVRSIPANSFAVGNPCRVIRPLTERDSMTHYPEILGDCAVCEETPQGDGE